MYALEQQVRSKSPGLKKILSSDVTECCLPGSAVDLTSSMGEWVYEVTGRGGLGQETKSPHTMRHHQLYSLFTLH